MKTITIVRNCKHFTERLRNGIINNTDEDFKESVLDEFAMFARQLDDANEILAKNGINAVIGLDGDAEAGEYGVTINGETYNDADMTCLPYYAVGAAIDRALGELVRSAHRSHKDKITPDKKPILDDIDKLTDKWPYIAFDNAVDMPSVNNAVKEFNGGHPIWEDMSDDELELSDASVADLERLSDEIRAWVKYNT